MGQTDKGQTAHKKKSLLGKWLDQLDKKMQEKSKESCGCSSNKSKGGKCC